VILAIFAKKTAVFGRLINTLAPPPIALKSCSTAQTDWVASLVDCTQKKFFAWGVQVFCE